MSGVLTLVAVLGTAVAAGAFALVVAEWIRSGSRRHEQRLTRLTVNELADLFVFIEPARFLRLNLAIALILPATLGLATGSVVVAIIALGVVLVAPGYAYHRLRKRRMRALSRQLPDAACSIASALRAGLGLWQAIEQVPRYQPKPIAQEFALVLRQHRMGVPLEETLASLAERSRLHDFQTLVATLGIAHDLGGGLAEALERLGATVRRRVAMEERIGALTSQGRLQGVIVTALPVVLVLVLFVIEPGPMSHLFVTPLGWLALTVIVGLEAAGWMLIRRIVRIDI